MSKNSIEEDIAIAKKLITTKFNNDYSIDNKDKEAIEHILTDYKRVLKENYVNKNKIREIMITNTNKLNKSVNEILKRIYKARIELCKELLKGDE